MARRVLSFAVLAVLVLALRWSATAFLPTGKPLLRGGRVGTARYPKNPQKHI